MNDKLIKLVEHLKTLKCKNLATFDLSDGDEEKFCVIVSGANTLETKKIADEVCEDPRFAGEKDGYHKGEWIIINTSPIILHIFTQPERTKYNLDRLYKSKEIDVVKTMKKRSKKAKEQ